MSTVTEIETALKELPLPQAQGIAQWLQTYLERQTAARAASAPAAPVQLPDYAARRDRTSVG